MRCAGESGASISSEVLLLLLLLLITTADLRGRERRVAPRRRGGGVEAEGGDAALGLRPEGLGRDLEQSRGRGEELEHHGEGAVHLAAVRREHLVPDLLLHGEHRTVYVVKGAKHLE